MHFIKAVLISVWRIFEEQSRKAPRSRKQTMGADIKYCFFRVKYVVLSFLDYLSME